MKVYNLLIIMIYIVFIKSQQGIICEGLKIGLKSQKPLANHSMPIPN